MATARKDFRTGELVNDISRGEDKLIELATISLHNSATVVNAVVADHRYIRPSSFGSPDKLDVFEKKIKEIKDLLGGSYSQADLKAVQDDVKKFTDIYASDLERSRSPSVAHSKAEFEEGEDLIDVSDVIGTLVELKENLEVLADRSAKTGREHIRSDISFARSERKAVEIIEELIKSGELDKLHDRLLGVYAEREKLLITKEAKDMLHAYVPAQDVAADVRGYTVGTLNVHEYGTGGIKSQEQPQTIKAPGHVAKETAPQTATTNAQAKSTGPKLKPRGSRHKPAAVDTNKFASMMLDYVKKQKDNWAMASLSAAQMKMLEDTAAGNAKLSKTDAIEIYKTAAAAWIKQSPERAQKFIIKSGVDISTATSMEDIMMFSRKLLIAYSKLYEEAQLSQMRLSKNHAKMLAWDDTDMRDDKNFRGRRAVWYRLYMTLDSHPPVAVAETSKPANMPPPTL